MSSLFTNVPCDLVLNILDKRYNDINTNCILPFDDVRYVTKFLFENTFFMFNSKYYRQRVGTPMGSPISSLFADLVMQDLEEECLKNFKKFNNYSPLFYFRYVDDTFLCVEKDLSLIHISEPTRPY